VAEVEALQGARAPALDAFRKGQEIIARLSQQALRNNSCVGRCLPSRLRRPDSHVTPPAAERNAAPHRAGATMNYLDNQ
jgi:hypothetical protein